MKASELMQNQRISALENVVIKLQAHLGIDQPEPSPSAGERSEPLEFSSASGKNNLLGVLSQGGTDLKLNPSGAAPSGEMKMSEEWRPVEGWPYEVSSLGRVRRTSSGRVVRSHLSTHGYPRISIYRDGKIRQAHVHSLVLEAFIGPKPTEKQANHIDGDKCNNSPDNLEWVTPRENTHHSVRTGLQGIMRGEATARAILTEYQVREVVTLADRGVQKSEIGKLFGVRRNTISNIVHGVTWSHVTGRYGRKQNRVRSTP